MKSNKKKKKKLLAALAALGIIAAASGTFAYLISQDQRINRMAAGGGADPESVYINETYEQKPILPDTMAVKQARVTNSGDMNVFVRLSYEEVIKYLTQKGKVTYSTTAYTGGPLSLTSDIPVEPKKGALNGYEESTGTMKAGTGVTLPAGFKVYAKGGKSYDGGSGTTTYSDAFVFVNEYTDGQGKKQQQNIKATYEMTDGRDSLANNSKAKEWNLTITKVEYEYYAQGYTYKANAWGKSSVQSVHEQTAGNVTGYALLGYKGTNKRDSVDFDYTLTATGMSALPAVKPVSDAAYYPVGDKTKNEVKNITADGPTSTVGGAGLNITTPSPEAHGLGHIMVEYNSKDIMNITSLASKATTTEAKWVYNPKDGWFYWTQPLKGGTDTANLLEAMRFGKVGETYTKSIYDLNVKMEAVQADAAAIDETWQLKDSADDETKNIDNQLKSTLK